MIESQNELLSVIDNGFCIGCGVCASVSNNIEISFDDFGRYQAQVHEDNLPDDISKICPFSNSSMNEDEIGNKIFSNLTNKDKFIGYYTNLYAGYVIDGKFRKNGSSGGFVSWLLCELKKRELVDKVIHVGSHENNTDVLFEYKISDDIEEIIGNSKSRYYPMEMSKVLTYIRRNPGKYAIVGVPCFIKALRLLMLREKIFQERIIYCISLVCGHLKSSNYAKMLTWQQGYKPDSLVDINFRKKGKSESANLYSTELKIKDSNGTKIINKNVSELFGTDWGLGLFKYKSCDFCDDIFGETADLTVGDAWLPKYLKDINGTNIIISRNKVLDEIIQSSYKKLFLNKLKKKEIIKSQASGIFHKTIGVSYRIILLAQNNLWYPKKRVEVSKHSISKRIQTKFILRQKLSEMSHQLFLEAQNRENFNYFKEKLEPIINEYYVVNSSRLRKILKKIYIFLIRHIKR